MIKFKGTIVQFGFGAVGKAFYEKVKNEIQFNQYKYYVLTANKQELFNYKQLDGILANFIVVEIKKENYQEVFSKYLHEGDLLIDFADGIGTYDLCKWCGENNIMYLNTGEADWPENWYCIFEENKKKEQLKLFFKDNPNINRHPIVVHHGNNPGLVSHFTKAAIAYIVKTQFPLNFEYHTLLKQGAFNLLAQKLEINLIQVSDVDYQKLNVSYDPNILYNTWCIDSYFFEILSEATLDVSVDNIQEFDDSLFVDKEKGYLRFNEIAINKKCSSVSPLGKFEGYIVPHEETVSIANSLEVYNKEQCVYRPNVMFVYAPCEYAQDFIKQSKVNDYPNADPNKPQDNTILGQPIIIRGHSYPNKSQIAYKEHVQEGCEYVGMLLISKKFKPVWVGNRVTFDYLESLKNHFWQTPTITPVAMSALSAVCWMIENKDKPGLFFPDDIENYSKIIKTSEKYISKTIYKTFTTKEIENSLLIKIDNLKIKDLFK